VGLEELSVKLFKMGEIAEQTVAFSIEGFLKGLDVSEKVYSLSEALVAMNTDIEDKAFELTARYQPVASDLRIIKSYMKIGYDLERIGRYAWDISFDHKKFAKLERCEYSQELVENLAEKVMEMVSASVAALKNHNAEMAETLATTEEEVDKMSVEYLDRLARAPPTTKCLVASVLAVRYLERIADHTTYMGESIVYIVTGKKVILR